MKTACLGLRSVRNYATPFHNFCKIVPLRSVFAPVEFSSKLLRRPLTAANKSKTEPFWLCFTHGLRLFPHNQASGFLNGQCPGERKKA